MDFRADRSKDIDFCLHSTIIGFSPMTNTIQASLAQSLVTVKEILKQFASQPDFLAQLELAFGGEFDSNIALGIAASIKADDFSQILSIPALATNNVAFDSGNNQTLIDDDFLTQNSSRQQLIVNLLLQDVGRKFDILLTGTVDSSGDDGTTFAAIVQGEARSAIAFEQPPVTDDSTSSNDHIQQPSIARPIWYDANPLFESVVSEIDGGQTLHISPAIWYNPVLDPNTQDTVVYEESYTTIEYGNPIIESEGTVIEGEQPVVIGKPFFYDPGADISAQYPISESVVSETAPGKPAQMLPAIWYNSDLDLNTQDTVIYEESYVTIDDGNSIVESEVTVIEGEQPIVVSKPLFYDPEADISTQDPISESVVSEIAPGKPAQMVAAIWYNPDLDPNTQDTVIYEEPYTTIEYGNPIIDSEVSVIEGEQPVVIGKPFYYDPKADISTDDTIPDGESYVSIDDGNSIVESQQLLVCDGPRFVSTEDIVSNDQSYTDSIEDSNQGSSTTRIMQGSNNEGIDVPTFNESDSSLTNEELNNPTGFYCVLPVFDLEYIVEESSYTGGSTFIFGGEDISMNTASALLLAPPITLEFATGIDKLLLSQSTFSSIYTNADGEISSFANVADDSLVDLNDAEIVYSQSTGKLFYNQNGANIGLGDAGGQFATLSGSSALAASDFGVFLDLSAC